MTVTRASETLANVEERDVASRVLDGLAVAGIGAVAVGLAMLASGPLGFDRDRVMRGVLAELPATLPAAIAVLVAVALELGAGMVLARAVLGRPFEDLLDASLAGFAGAVVKDVALLGTLGQLGFFSQPLLLAVDVVLLIVGVWSGPLVARAALRVPATLTPLGALIGFVWAGTVVLQLAAPVVPFLDVLPNHVAPAEHMRTFGQLTPLTETQSPIYGPSRTFLGYTAFVGAISTMTGLPAALAAAALILPTTLLVAAGVVRLANAVSGERIGPWALLTFALTASFARLTDVRATVVVLPLAAWSLALLAERTRPIEASSSSRRPPLPTAVTLGMALGATLLVHPVVGALTVATLVVVGISMPARVGGLAIAASATGAVVALPQAATMLAIPLPAVAAFLALPAAVVVGLALDRLQPIHRPLLVLGRALALAFIPVALLFAGPLARALARGLEPLASTMEVSLAVLLVGVALRARNLRSPVLLGALFAGAVVAGLTQLVPEKGSLLDEAIRYEVPKTLQYWVPVWVAIAAAIALHRLWTHESLRLGVKATILAAFLAAAALPIRSAPIDILHLGEHRFAETLAIDLRHAARGYWAGYPDSRQIVDAPRRDLLVAVRAQIAAGRIRADTPVLHVASSFQQWVSTPLGVFAGVTETDVTPDALVNIHTVGGRLEPMARLPALLASRAYPYLLLEPAQLPSGTRADVVAAGYRSIHANDQGELFALDAPAQ